MANNDAMRYLATVKRQSAPPRCNPCTIVLQVLALGMVFIGLTMTIIAHWPGSTSIGENPLKIAGPILLSVGFVLFSIGIVLICSLNVRERQRWERMIDNFTASRPPHDQSSFGPPSVKTGQDTESGNKHPPAQQPDSGPGTYPDKGGSGPRPGQAYFPDDSFKRGGYPHPGGESSFDVEDDQGVPDPVRATKKRRPRNPGTGSNDDLSGDSLIGSTTVTTTTTTTRIVKRPVGADSSIEESSTSTRPKTSKNNQDDGRGNGNGGSRPGTRGAAGQQPGSASPGGNRLLVHVKAQPGATVHIHPSGGPPVQPKPAFSTYSHSTASGETDI